MHERLEEYSLSLHPGETRLIEFGRLAEVVAGFFEYHAVPTNSRALNWFRRDVSGLWRRSLQRRNQKDRTTCIG